MKIKNIDKAAERIKLAIKNSERIIVYADSDGDGICSAAIFQEAIKNLGGVADIVVFPNREEDGYGINLKALDFLKAKAPALFITLDLGIGNVKEIALANEMGFEVIVVDHHLPLAELPPASIIVDPQQPGDTSGMSYLCNAGVTLKLAEELLPEMASGSRKSLLELAALATISDMMPKVGDNVKIIEEGLRSLQNTFRPGLLAFLELFGAGRVASEGHMKIISALNAAESINFMNDAFLLLITADQVEAQNLAQQLLGNVRAKQQKIESIVREVERRIALKPDQRIIFEGDPAWKLIFAGPVASQIAIKYGRPTFIYKRMDSESSGSVRSLKEGENSVVAMGSCKDILITYGGHPKASGFRLKNENLAKFEAGLIKHFNSL